MDMKKFVEEVTNGVNCLGFKPKEFCKLMSKEHRTLQANFTNLCFAWLETCADMELEQRYDARNEYEVHRAAYLARLLPLFQDEVSIDVKRLAALLYDALEYIEEITNENIMETDVKDALGITQEEYDKITRG